jgi:hypothetical protein
VIVIDDEVVIPNNNISVYIAGNGYICHVILPLQR